MSLHAAVIDDFEGPGQKWLCGGGGCDYLGPTQAGGRLTFAGQFPPSGDNRDNVWWPASLPVGNLNGRTVELRMDLVGLIGANHFFLLGAQGQGGYYVVARSQDQTMLAKVSGGGGGHSVLLYEDAPVKYENTTVVLKLSPVGDSLRITVQLLDKDDANAVIYEGSFLDSPASDVGVPTNLPPGFTWVPDQGAPMMNIELAWVGVAFIDAGTPQPAEVVADNLEYTLYPAPELAIEKSVLLSWPENTAEEQIVVTAESLASPWIPCLEPIFKRNGELCVVVPITHNLQWQNPYGYFKLVPGYQLSDDFSDPAREWWECFPDPRQYQVDRVDGALRITSPAGGGAPSRAVLAAVPLSELASYVHADFAMSFDILDWTTNLVAIGASQTIGLVARGTPTPTNCQTTISTYNYMGLFTLQENSPARVAIYAYPPNEVLVSQDVTLDPEKAYRLVFCGSGSELTLRLFDLENLAVPQVSLQVTDTSLTQGVPALWINAGLANGAYDITIDNYVVCGTKP